MTQSMLISLLFLLYLLQVQQEQPGRRSGELILSSLGSAGVDVQWQ